MRAPAKHPETTIWAYGVHQFRRNNTAYIHHGFKPGAGAFQSAGLFIRTSAFYFFKKYQVSCIAAVANCADYVKRIFRGKII